ncbi:MAG: cytochrome c maturation protein CcmE [Ignavibacteria bacterium]
MRSKYIFGGVIVAVFLTLMIYLFSQSNIQYENNFRNVMSKDKTVKATGIWVREKSYDINKESRIFSFYMVDQNGTEMKVVYEGTIPNNFESAQSIVVTGKYSNGYFHAKDILTKCPSKYQEEEVKSPGV